MGEHDGQDPDRAAILARRRRFIALALGGLTTGCSPGKPGPDPGTSGDGTRESDGSSTDGESGESGSSSETGSVPCLKYDLPPDDESGSDESDTGSEDGGTTTGPRPCLVPPNG